MELDPKKKNAQSYRAYAFLSKQEWNKAVEDYSKVIERSPDDIGRIRARSLRVPELGKNNEAIGDLTKVIEASRKMRNISASVVYVSVDGKLRESGR